ncbi:MAG: DNA-binding protein [Elusimicrobiota bacterium]|nr:DNA-binding protein [Elusimicrobiota bacterium]
MKLIALRIPEELDLAIEKIAREINRAKSFIIRKSLETYLNEHIDYQIGLDRLNDKDDLIIPEEEMIKRVGR